MASTLGSCDACLQLKEEHKLKIAPRHGAGFELSHVDVQRRELGEDLIERAGLILEREDKADAVRAGVDDGVLRHAEKARVIILAVLNFVAHTFKAVKRGAGMRGDGGRVTAAALGDQLRRLRRVAAGDHPHAGKAAEEPAALTDGLLMGVYFCNVL